MRYIHQNCTEMSKTFCHHSTQRSVHIYRRNFGVHELNYLRFTAAAGNYHKNLLSFFLESIERFDLLTIISDYSISGSYIL